MAQSDQWMPPERPDARAILREAVADARSGRHETALAKYVWFHENALTCDPALQGVRLSFALGYWRNLADEFPPAMTKLVELRDRAETRFRKSGFSRDAFHDLASLNRELDEEQRTAQAFMTVHKNDREAAARIYHLAQPALIANGDFGACGQYLDPEKQIGAAIRIYHRSQNYERESADEDPRPPSTARPRFMHEVATLVALLIKNDRTSDAQLVVSQALGELDNVEFKERLDSALAGHVPNPWP